MTIFRSWLKLFSIFTIIVFAIKFEADSGFEPWLAVWAILAVITYIAMDVRQHHNSDDEDEDEDEDEPEDQ